MPNEEKKTLLVIEDDTALLNLYRQLFERQGFTVLAAMNGEKGLEIYKQTASIDVVVLDMMLPGMSGDEVLLEIQQLNPDQQIIICSGYQVKEKFAGNVHILQKPFLTPTLLEMLKEAAVQSGIG